MADYPQGGGGGPAGIATSGSYALDKPYDVYGQWTPDMASQINEMFDLLFKQSTRAAADIASSGGGTGNVVGPASAADTDIVLFDGITGKLIKDSGYTVTSLIAAASSGNGLITTSTNITAAQLVTMSNTTPIALTAAPGATNMIIPVSFAIEKNKSTETLSSNTLNIQYLDAGFTGFNFVSVNCDLTNASRAAINSGVTTSVPFTNYATRDPRNQALALLGNAAITISAAGDGLLGIRVTVAYYIVSTIGVP